MRLKAVTEIMLMLLMTSILIVLTSSVPTIAQTNSTTTVYLNPPTIKGTTVGQEFTVNLMIRDAYQIRGWQAGLAFNATLLNCTRFSEGKFLKNVGSTLWQAGTINNTAGVITIHAAVLLGLENNATGDGRLAYLTFKVKAPGVSDLHLRDVKVIKGVATEVPINIIDVYTVVLDTTHYTVFTVSNSTGATAAYGSGFYDHAFSLPYKEISFKVTGPHLGFSNITIPKALLWLVPPNVWVIIVDGTPLSIEEKIVTENATHTSLYFTYTLGIHNIQITTGPPPPEYTLTIYSSPTGVTFTVDSVSRTTPWSGTYSYGTSVSVVMPETHEGYVWSHWLEDGDTNRTKTVTMDTSITLTALYACTFDVVLGDVRYPVSILSNSTISNFNFNQTEMQISFNVTGESGTTGYCIVTIPKSLLTGSPWTIKIDNTTITDFDEKTYDTHTFLYFTYTHESPLQVTIEGTWVVPEFPLAIILPLFMILSLTTVVFVKLKKKRE